MKALQIKPNDNLFLGSGKNFEKGESTWISTKLMPYPSVFYGAICSLLLSLNKERNKEYICESKPKSDPRKYLTIGNIYLYNSIDQHYYIPAPMDMFYKDDNRRSTYICKLVKTGGNITTSSGMDYLFTSPKDAERCDGMFVSLSTFYTSYYFGNNEVDIIKPNDITTNSYKVGIQRSKSYTAEDEHLYRIDLTEFKEDKDNSWSYIVEYDLKTSWWEDGKNHIDSGYLKLGGENKVCKYFSVDTEAIDIYSQVEDNKQYDYIKLILMSPLVVKDGDADIDLKNIKIIAASTGKAYNIGGFDMQFKNPKPMYDAFPEGSVLMLDVRELENRTVNGVRNYIKKQESFLSQKSGFGEFRLVPFDKEWLPK